MKAKITILLLVLNLVFCAGTWAAPRLVVWQKNGQKVFYDLAEEPHTTFENGLLVITTNNVRVEYQLTNILRYTYEGVNAGIETPLPDGTGFRQNGDDIGIYGLAPDGTAQLYDLNGRLLESGTAEGNRNNVHFSLRNLPADTYIVKVGEQSLKFMKR